MIRIRRVESGLLRRRRYEVEFREDDDWKRRVTRTPVTLLDEQLGVGDAWALVHAADETWENGDRSWVTLQS